MSDISDIEKVCRKLFKLQDKVQGIRAAANKRVAEAESRLTDQRAMTRRVREDLTACEATITRLKAGSGNSD